MSRRRKLSASPMASNMERWSLRFELVRERCLVPGSAVAQSETPGMASTSHPVWDEFTGSLARPVGAGAFIVAGAVVSLWQRDLLPVAITAITVAALYVAALVRVKRRQQKGDKRTIFVPLNATRTHWPEVLVYGLIFAVGLAALAWLGFHPRHVYIMNFQGSITPQGSLVVGASPSPTPAPSIGGAVGPQGTLQIKVIHGTPPPTPAATPSPHFMTATMAPTP